MEVATEPVDYELCGSGNDECHRVRYHELKITESGALECSEVKAPINKSPPRNYIRHLIGDEAEVNVDCTTNSTGEPPGSGRKSCSDEDVHHLPENYVFVENEVKKKENSGNGERSVDVFFEDRVEILPGSGIMMAQSMRVIGKARSPSGQGERGWIHATVTCRFVKYR